MLAAGLITPLPRLGGWVRSGGLCADCGTRANANWFCGDWDLALPCPPEAAKASGGPGEGGTLARGLATGTRKPGFLLGAPVVAGIGAAAVTPAVIC